MVIIFNVSHYNVTYYLVIFILYFFVFLLGSCIGSFLNVCIYRIPLNLSVAKGRSFCPGCHKQLRPMDMVPVLSYLFLKGKCRSCKCRISPRYPLVETLTGGLFVLAFYVKGFGTFSAVLSLFFSILVVISFIDFQKGIIPDRLNICILLLSPIYLLSDPSRFSVTEHLIGAFIISLPLLLLAFFGGFGGGDIKLMAVCGFMMGARLIVSATVLAILSGALYCVILLLLKKADRKSVIPFGPFLSLGMTCAVLWGNEIILWYLSLMV